jgi:hypothetical protein
VKQRLREANFKAGGMRKGDIEDREATEGRIVKD